MRGSPSASPSRACVCLRTTSRRKRSLRRLSRQCAHAVRIARPRSPTRAPRPLSSRENENWVDRMRATKRAVETTMKAPVRLKSLTSAPATTSPTAPPARTGSPSKPTVPRASDRNPARESRSPALPTAFVYGESIGRHQKSFQPTRPRTRGSRRAARPNSCGMKSSARNAPKGPMKLRAGPPAPGPEERGRVAGVERGERDQEHQGEGEGHEPQQLGPAPGLAIGAHG